MRLMAHVFEQIYKHLKYMSDLTLKMLKMGKCSCASCIVSEACRVRAVCCYKPQLRYKPTYSILTILSNDLIVGYVIIDQGS